MYVKESLSIIRRVDLEQHKEIFLENAFIEVPLPKAKGILFEPSIDPPQKDFMNPSRDVLESASAENKNSL